MSKRCRTWCFTDNECKEAVWDSIDCQYVLYGRETAPTTGQRHLQGIVTFGAVRSLAQVKKLHPTAHLEPAISVPASIAYCKKDGDFVERGVPLAQGHRSDLDAVIAMVNEGATLKSIAEVHPGAIVRYHQGIAKLISLKVDHRSQDVTPQVFWFHGPSASGKSRAAFEEAGPDAYVYCKTGKFWEGYCGQTNVIFDDFRPDQMPFAILLSVLDRYRMQVEVKGGSCPLAATKFWITTPDDVATTYTRTNHVTGGTWETENITQLQRRVVERRFGPVPLYAMFHPGFYQRAGNSEGPL